VLLIYNNNMCVYSNYLRETPIEDKLKCQW